MRILFVTQWFDPEPAFKGGAFAAALAARGHRVEVVTAFPNYPGGKLYPGYRIRPYLRDEIEGVPVHRLAIWPSHDRSAIGRMANYLSFFVTLLCFGLMHGGKYDVIYVYHPPITPGCAAAIFACLYRRALVVEVQDLWPDSVSASGMASNLISKALNLACNFVYRHADLIVPQSEKMLERLAQRGVPRAKLRRLYNWATYQASSDAVDPVFPAGDALNIVYGGNLGQAQSLTHVIDAAAGAREQGAPVHLHFFGDGIERDQLERHARDLGVGAVTFHRPVDRRSMDRIFDAADALILHLKDDPLYEVTIPSKVQHYLAVGRPVIAGVAGEAAALLRASGAAIVCAPEDVNAMAAAMRDLASTAPAVRQAMGERGRDFYRQHFGFDRAITETLTILSEATAPAARG